MKILRGAFAAAAIAALAGNAAAAPSDILFVLDGSGSMWGQIDGVAKIDTAKKTITRLMNDVPAQARLGFTTYGTTSKRNCEDASVLNGIGSARSAIKASIAGLQSLGKTPLQASLARNVQSSGLTMKVHVVGCDVDAEARAQLECIAEQGYGRYFNASNTAGFATAMRDVVQAASEPESEPMSQRLFFDDFEGEALEEGDWVVDNRDPNFKIHLIGDSS